MKHISLQTIANSTTGNMLEEHILDIPPCCPVSKNPQPGSQLIIRYRPQGYSLDIISLKGYIHCYCGGLHDEQGNLLVRDMEGMLARIQNDCEAILGILVQVEANLCLLPRQKMHVLVGNVECEEA